jgi:hypothetical protein
MSKILAKTKTVARFTNLWDGTVLPSATVGQVIDYYETLLLQSHLEGKPTTVRKPIGNIEANFIEDEIDYMHGDDYSEMYGGL